MEHRNPYPFRTTSGAIRQQVGDSWRRSGLANKIVAIVVAISLLCFLLLVVLPLALIAIVLTCAVWAWRTLATSVSNRIHGGRPHDTEGRRNVRVVDRTR